MSVDGVVLTKGRVGDGHPEAAAGPKFTRQNVLTWCGQSQGEQEMDGFGLLT